MNYAIAVPIVGLAALAFGMMKASWVKKQEAGTDEMKQIANEIQVGAMEFLKTEYKVLAGFVVVIAILLAVGNMSGTNQSPLIAVSFVVGALASATAGWLGMKVATDANVRTTHAAKSGLSPALAVAFSGGTVMGMAVVGLALLGLGGLWLLYTNVIFATDASGIATTLNVLAGFSMGASSIALFSRVGGGIP